MIESKTMVDQADDPPPVGGTAAAPDLPQEGTKQEEQGLKTSVDSAVDLSAISLLPDRDSSNSASLPRDLVTRTRNDSMQADALMATKDTQPARVGLESPLKIRTTEPRVVTSQLQQRRDSISTSPTLSKHVMPAADVHGESLAPFEPPSPSTSSPKAERLPSIHQITSSLTELAEAATQEIPRQQQGFSHHHSQSFGSAMSQSPVLSGHLYPASIQTSPQASYYPALVVGRSPTSTIGGESRYASPPVYSPYGAYSHRRASMTDGVPPVMPRLPTGSSSGDSYGGYPSSGTEGYSTNHTTPVDIMEHTPRPMLPPPPGMHAQPIPPPPIVIPGPYKCDVPNCTAGTFQTQYLLNSHKNVHSQSRPHYCPVAGCSRSEGGKGFKRKNEMIRHGLVHNSPGYVCPFCPEREHRYPRPDNLQRHVRVHHVDKDRDDDVLRDVLNQRTEGQGKTRRRRTNTGLMVAAT
ncbi:hypothetical protein MBLNU13_g10217t1 [Cladosporium sp. NU13]